jgi:hypothetical protein
MISSKFKRNAGRKPSWNPKDIQSINHQRILISNHDNRIREQFPGQEGEILAVE